MVSGNALSPKVLGKVKEKIQEAKTLSPLQKIRCLYDPPLPDALKKLTHLHPQFEVEEKKISSEIATLFPLTSAAKAATFSLGDEVPSALLRVGVLFSGGQAPGGHNVICGLFDALKTLNPENVLIGFLNGPKGLIDNAYRLLDEQMLAPFRNQGGFDLFGSSRTKIETDKQFEAVRKTVLAQSLDALVIIGGDDSNTNAALLAENFAAVGIKTSVLGIPKTIDGDLQNDAIEISFGFDSASKTYAESIGNVLKDAKSAGKYYFFIRLMGRSASHLTLECALKTHPNFVLISEEVDASTITLAQIVTQITDLICERASIGKQYGVVLIPEGIIEFIPECRQLILELNALLACGGNVPQDLTPASQNCFMSFPEGIQKQLILDRDPHGNVQVSKIESERFIIELVKQELLKKDASFSLNAQPLFFGYEGRSCLPSNFDAKYTYALGYVAAVLGAWKMNGYMATLKDLHLPVSQWQLSAYPIVKMLQLEERKGENRPVIQKTLVDLQGKCFKEFASKRKAWKLEDLYLSPGPIQFFGPEEVTEEIPKLLASNFKTSK